MQALDFTGTDNYAIAAAASNNNLTARTYCAWVSSPPLGSGDHEMFARASGTTGPSTRQRFSMRGIDDLYMFVRRNTPGVVSAARSNFKAYIKGRNAPQFVAGVMDTTGASGLPRLYMGTLQIPASEPTVYDGSQTNGSGTFTDDAAASIRIGNTFAGTAPFGPIALFAMFNRVLTEREIRRFQFRPWRFRRDPSCVLFLPFNVPANVIRDLSESGNHATASLARIAMPRATIALPTRLAARQRALVFPTSTGVTGTGAASLGALSGSGAGAVDVQGAGSGTISAVAAAGVANVRIAGAGAATLALMSAQGSASIAITGAGSAALAALLAAGQGQVALAGDGSALIPSLAADGEGSVGAAGAISGQGAAVLAALFGAGAGKVGVAGVGAGLLGALDAAGIARVLVQADGAAALAAFFGAGGVTVPVSASGAASLAAFIADAEGSVSSVGSISGQGVAMLASLIAAGGGSVVSSVAVAARAVRARTYLFPAVRGVTSLMPKVRARTQLLPQVRGKTRIEAGGVAVSPAAPAPWWQHPNVRLAVFAEDQTPGSQVVVARVGPNGWLGDSASDTTNDPTLELTAPARIIMGQVANRGISFGDVLAAVLNDPAGYTIVESVELASLVSMTVWRKQDLATFHGSSLLLTNDGSPDGLRIDADYFYATGFTPRDQTNAPAAADRVGIGRSLIGHSVDPTLPRASRYGIWRNGAAVSNVAVFSGGAEPGLTIDVPGESMRFGGPRFSLAPPQAMSVFVVARGAMPAAWHAEMYSDMVAKGWT